MLPDNNEEDSPIKQSVKPNPYPTSTLIEKLRTQKRQRKPLKIAFLDIDSTMTGDVKRTNETRQELERLGYAIAFVTTRTEEMIMSHDEYLRSRKLGFRRPRPLLKEKNGKCFYVKPEEKEPYGLLDPDIIAGSTGTQLLVKQSYGGYAYDYRYEEGMLQDSPTWRTKTLELLHYLDAKNELISLSGVDIPQNYLNADINVATPLFRIIIRCHTLKNKLRFLDIVRNAINDPSIPEEIKAQFENIRITDDSNPRKEKYALYLTPRNAYKAQAAETVVENVCKTLKVERQALKLLIAGDSFPDVEMGLIAGKGAKATFILPGGSRLTEAFTMTDTEFAGEDFRSIRKSMSELQTEGTYRFHIPLFVERHIVIGDVAYEGTRAVDTLYSYLHE